MAAKNRAAASFRLPRIPWGMFVAAAVAVGLWGVASRLIPQSNLYLPSPGDVGAALLELVAKGILPDYVAESLRRVVLATGIGLAIGVPLGILIGINSKVAECCYPLLNFFQSLGGVAILPLVMVWFGFSEKTILIAINYTVLFPVVFNVLVGVRSVPRIYVKRSAHPGGLAPAHRVGRTASRSPRLTWLRAPGWAWPTGGGPSSPQRCWWGPTGWAS